MQILDQAVAVMRRSGAEGGKVAAQLDEIAAIGEQAARVWQGYLDKPGAAGDKYSLITWIGPERSRELYDLSLKARHLVDTVCAAAGPEARFLVMDESPVVLAYVGLKEGETGPQAAAARLAAQQEVNMHLRVLAGQVRTLKAAKATTKPAAKKPAAKKSSKKKPVVKKATKPAAKKKATKKAKKKK